MKMAQLLAEGHRASPFRDLVRPVERPPIVVKEEWRELDSPARLRKKFVFADPVSRNSFVAALMAHETEVGHFSTVKMTKGIVVVSIKTAHVGVVTDMDREYAESIDAIFRDTVYDHQAALDTERRNTGRDRHR